MEPLGASYRWRGLALSGTLFPLSQAPGGMSTTRITMCVFEGVLRESLFVARVQHTRKNTQSVGGCVGGIKPHFIYASPWCFFYIIIYFCLFGLQDTFCSQMEGQSAHLNAQPQNCESEMPLHSLTIPPRNVNVCFYSLICFYIYNRESSNVFNGSLWSAKTKWRLRGIILQHSELKRNNRVS